MADKLPEGVTPRLGPDATGVGWVYQYSLYTGWYSPEHPGGLLRDPEADQWYPAARDVPAGARERLVRVRVFDEPGRCPLSGKPLRKAEQSLADLRSLQDWYLRYELTAVEGVSEIASIGGYVRQYQVEVDPNRLLAYDLSIGHLRHAIQRSNKDVGGRAIEMSEHEYMVRGLGYLGDGLSDPQTSKRVKEDLQQVSLGTTDKGTPIYLRDVANIQLGPELRRGVADRDGQGESVGGIVVMRFGENAYQVIQNVKERLKELKAGLPPGVEIRADYDRSALIERAVNTLWEKLGQQMVVVTLIVVLFLLHLRSFLVVAFVLPTGVLASIILMNLLDVNANIMSLSGIALTIGVMVDSAVVLTENTHKHLEQGLRGRSRSQLVIEAYGEVGPQLFFSLLIITVCFLPIFALVGPSGRLFKPMAMTWVFTLSAASILSITIVPVLMTFFVRGRILAEQRNPLNRMLIWLYRPAFRFCMKWRLLVLLLAIGLVVITFWPYQQQKCFSHHGHRSRGPLESGRGNLVPLLARLQHESGRLAGPNRTGGA